jgi:hypothetical protein
LTVFDGADARDYLTGPAAITVIGFGPDGTVWAQQDGALHVIAPAGPSAPTTTVSQSTPDPSPAPAPAQAPLGSVLRSLVGVTGEVGTWTGIEWIARLDPVMHDDANAIRGLEALADAADARLDDITIATALVERTPGNYASVTALRIPGSEMFDLLDPAVAAMASQIERPTASWDRVHDRSFVRVKDAAMPGAYPITFYPSEETLWVLQADRSIITAILQELPAQTSGPAADLRCEMLQEPFLESFTTGDAEQDLVYLSRCVTCDQLLDLMRSARIADVGVAETVLQERCGRTRGPTASPEPSQAAATREPPASGSEPADRWGAETVASGFAMRFPAGWRVEIADKEVDVHTAEPGTA